MKAILNILVAAGCVIYLNGCSKAENQTESPTTVVSESATPAPTTSAAQPPPSESAVNIENVNVALQKQDYDAAVDILVRANNDTRYLNDSARLASYLQQKRLATEALSQAMSNDPKARAAYERLGRETMGR